MICKFCNSNLDDVHSMIYNKFCVKCKTMFALNIEYYVVGYYKTLKKDEVVYIAQYFYKQDVTILTKNGKRILEYQGEVSLDSILNKIKLIEVFS